MKTEANSLHDFAKLEVQDLLTQKGLSACQQLQIRCVHITVFDIQIREKVKPKNGKNQFWVIGSSVQLIPIHVSILNNIHNWYTVDIVED